ncbi:MAG: 2Fe-2S iron-sulfur cluster-binding protein [Anaerococcus hydrogenalis]|nr:2Fe-2S iron-sulfur cluster-binding protein [Anaerococcus hydrogenalis]
MVNLTINGKNVEVSEATTVLDAARSLNINIPTLCHMDLQDIKFVNKLASCRVCLVEDLDKGKFIPSCATFVKEGMNIRTDSQEVIKARRTGEKNHSRITLIRPPKRLFKMC